MKYTVETTERFEKEFKRLDDIPSGCSNPGSRRIWSAVRIRAQKEKDCPQTAAGSGAIGSGLSFNLPDPRQ